mgnify:CR=1 FL=1
MRSLLALSLLMTATSSMAAEPPVELVRLEWSGTVKPGMVIHVDNPWGELLIKQRHGTVALLHAVMQKIGEHPKHGELKAIATEARVDLKLVYPDGQAPSDVRDGRIDAVLLVPSGIALEASVERGDLVTKAIDNPLTAHSENTDLDVRAVGPLDLSSAGGRITVRLLENGLTGTGRIVTRKGDIDVYFPVAAIPRFRLVGGRGHTTDSLALLSSRQFEGRVTWMGDDHGPLFDIQSDSGAIRLNSWPPPAAGNHSLDMGR